MLSETTELLLLRWRTTQWLLAVAQGHKQEMAAVREAMRIEGLTADDMLDEISLLYRQFGHRPLSELRNEATRLWLKASKRP